MILRSNHRVLPCLALVCAALLTGCVAQERADDLRHVVRTANEQIEVLTATVDERNARIAELEQQLQAARSGGDVRTQQLVAQLDATRAERDRFAALMTRLDAQVRAAGRSTRDASALEPRLDAQLRGLAAREAGAMSYDPQRGMIQLQSDLTFATGSTALKPEAAQALRQLASLINDPAAADTTLRIVGHTDNVPVRNPAHVDKYEDNWGLSAFRAKSVMHALNQAGVDPARILIAARGDTQPLAPNGPSGNPANRRVELFLTAHHAASTPTPPTTTGTPTTPATQPTAEESATDPHR